MATHHPLILIALLFGLMLVVGLLKATRPRDDAHSRPWPLEAKGPLLTDAERAVYRRLVEALPDCLVLAQVQLLQLVKFRRGVRPYAVLNRISQLSLDFVVLRPNASVIAAIELDDASHKRADRIRADRNKTHALKSAGIPLVRWTSADRPDAAAIRTALGLATPGKS